MNDYIQPDFYRFSEDSLKLVKWVTSRVHSANQILDLGAGSGIIGIELANFYKSSSLVLLEVQSEYLPFLNKNISEWLNPDTMAKIANASFKNWKSAEKFDLIVCNPPYYLPGHGEVNKDPRRAIARSFILDSWEDLLETIACNLTPTGKAFLVVKKDKRVMNLIEKNNSSLEVLFHEEGDLFFVELSRLNKN